MLIRRFLPADSLDDLARLLRKAFARLGRQGLNCTCVDQTPETTRARIGAGDCFVAVAGDRIVGTITLQGIDPDSPIPCYRMASVASIHQFAVDPDHQESGIGRALLRTAETWARSRHCTSLALDTPQPAQHLHTYYGRRGFRRIDTVHLASKRYLSAVFSKKLGPMAPEADARFRPAHPKFAAPPMRISTR